MFMPASRIHMHCTLVHVMPYVNHAQYTMCATSGHDNYVLYSPVNHHEYIIIWWFISTILYLSVSM